TRHGAMALCWSMDKVGPITRDVRDLALVFDAIHGRDDRDPSTLQAPFRFTPGEDLSGYRIGAVKGAFGAGRDRAVLDVLRERGAEISEVDLPKIAAAKLYPILNVEAAAAFDDITRDGRVKKLVSQGRGAWPSSFRRARFYPAVEFLQATRLRQRLVDAWEEMMSGFDALVSPGRGGVLVPTNFTGHPTVCVPNGFGASGKRPTSISFVGRLLGDGRALEVAWHYQQATGWHLKRPGFGK
ncbi:MAG: amidase, partial [Planctomycetes bacterium]|nr:amidase [Planctomycetota bacterium]